MCFFSLRLGATNRLRNVDVSVNIKNYLQNTLYSIGEIQIKTIELVSMCEKLRVMGITRLRL